MVDPDYKQALRELFAQQIEDNTKSIAMLNIAMARVETKLAILGVIGTAVITALVGVIVALVFKR